MGKMRRPFGREGGPVLRIGSIVGLTVGLESTTERELKRLIRCSLTGLKNEGGSSGSGVEEEFLAVLDEDEEDGTRGETGTLPMRKELEFTERVWCFLLGL